jgi:hypothetical protein
MPMDGRPCLFSWQVATPHPEFGSCGVSSDRDHAVQAVAETMRATNATRGIVQICHLSWWGPYYLYGAVIARAERIEATGAIVWHDETLSAGTSFGEISPAVREAIACMPLQQSSAGREPQR